MHTLYHGTSKRHARSILRHGLRDSTWLLDNPKRAGSLGHGTYLTANWKVGLFFGPVLFRVELLPGTRLLNLDVPPDQAILDLLKRKFGQQILTHPIRHSVPHNKRITLEEGINLARYHYHARACASCFSKKHHLHKQLLLSIRSTFVRYGIHGWGETHDLDGICLFDPTRILLREIVVVLPTADLARACNDYERTDGPHASLAAMIQTMHRATNPGAANSRTWFHQANAQLQQQATSPSACIYR